MRPVLIDCDPGTDDALAIFMALNSPELEVVGLTTVGGNASLADTTRNALALLEIAGRSDVPVWRGAGESLQGGFTYAYEFHGSQGIGVQLPTPSAEVRPGPAADAISTAARQRPGELTLLALGPLTNVAVALRQRPQLAGELAEILVMGGALETAGNVTAWAEFNIYNDPLAAAEVFASGASVALVGLDVTTKVELDRSFGGWGERTTPTAAAAEDILRSRLAVCGRPERYSLHDPLTVAAAIDPGLISWSRGTLAVDIGGGAERGRTVLAADEGGGRGATGVDADRARALIVDLVRGPR